MDKMEYNSIQDFRTNYTHVYHSSVVPMLEKLEKERKFLKLVSLLSWILVFVIIGIYYFTLGIKSEDGFWFGVVLIIFCPGTCFHYVRRAAKNFESKIKTKIMPEIMKAFGNFNWTQASVIDIDTIKATRLNDQFETKDDDDNFYGTYKDLSIKINEAKITYGSRGDYDKARTEYIFKGVFVEIDVKKPFKGHTIIRKRRQINSHSYEEVKLEDPEFSRKYYVDSNDQVEARYVLTTSFMERFKNIKNAFRASQMEASLKDNKIIIAISTNRDLFKLGDINKPVNDTKQFTQLLNEFVSILAIVDELKLNQNIGL